MKFRIQANYKILLLLVVLIAIFFRFWNIDKVPPSASMDEASIGYNAYSVLLTGVDEFGDFPLISQRGYDDWRRSTYLLMVTPFVGLFGLNPISIRLPSLLLSILVVISTYKIVTLLFKKDNKFAQYSALASAFFLAITPWHIYISRLGHESNACLSFMVFGILFFLMGLRKSFFWIFSLVFFTLSLISYYSGQVFIPLIGLLLLIIYRKKVISSLKKDRILQLSSIVFIFIMIPILLSVFSKESLTRFDGTSTFSKTAHESLYKEMVLKRNEAASRGDVVGQFVNNRRLYPFYVWLEGYTSHFNPNWIFKNPDNGIFKAPSVGLLYLWMLPFILLGLYSFYKSDLIAASEKILIFGWLFIGPLPASIATQTPHAMRSYGFLPVWQIFAAFGVLYFLKSLGKYKMVGVIALTLIIFYELTSFYVNYFYRFPFQQSKSFHYALGKILPEIAKIDKNYEKIIFSNNDNLFQSYMVFLYYNKYDPATYQKQGGTISGGYAATHKFGKYEFRPIDWENEKVGTLLIGNPGEIPASANKIIVGKYLDESIGVVVSRK